MEVTNNNLNTCPCGFLQDSFRLSLNVFEIKIRTNVDLLFERKVKYKMKYR